MTNCKSTSPIYFLDADRRTTMKAMLSSAVILAIGVIVPALIYNFSRVPLPDIMPKVVGVSGVLLLAGAFFLMFNYNKLRHPIYLSVAADGVVRWRPFFAERVGMVRPGSMPMREGRRLVWTDIPEGLKLPLDESGRAYIDLPAGVRRQKW